MYVNTVTCIDHVIGNIKVSTQTCRQNNISTIIQSGSTISTQLIYAHYRTAHSSYTLTYVLPFHVGSKSVPQSKNTEMEKQCHFSVCDWVSFLKQ